MSKPKLLPGSDAPRSAQAPSALNLKARQGADRLSIDLTVEQKRQFAMEALTNGWKGNQYFWKMWEHYRTTVLGLPPRAVEDEQKAASMAAYTKTKERRSGGLL